jgi:hypothetical protein
MTLSTNNVTHEPYPVTPAEKAEANAVTNIDVMSPDQEKKWPFNNKKLMTAMFGFAVVSLCLGGCSSSASNNPNTTTAASNNPGEKQPSIPNEAKSFVAEYGSRYADTATAVSTYYAEMAYEKTHNSKSLMMTDETVSNYNYGQERFPTSTLGFSLGELPLNIEVNGEVPIEVSMNIFNNYTKPMLERYMDLLARNPSAEEIKIIDKEFVDYCGGRYLKGYTTWDKTQADGIEKLQAMAKSIVAKHGSAANYSVAPASTDKNNLNATLFNKELFTVDNTFKGTDPTTGKGVEIEEITNNGIRLLVIVDKYQDKTVIQVKETFKDSQLYIRRQPVNLNRPEDLNYSYISIGQDL